MINIILKEINWRIDASVKVYKEVSQEYDDWLNGNIAGLCEALAIVKRFAKVRESEIKEEDKPTISGSF